METIPIDLATTIDTHSSFETPTLITSMAPQTNTQSPLSSPVSSLESNSTPGSIFTPRLSSSSSSTTLSSYSSALEETTYKEPDKKPPAICLQCATLELRCSLSRELAEERCGAIICCKRCERSGKSCIVQSADGEYSAGGMGGWEVKRRAEELLAPRRERWKWCLPKIPPGTRAALRPAWTRGWQFDRAREELWTEIEGGG